MTKNDNKATKPATPSKPGAVRGRKKRARMEDHPQVQTWINDFIERTEDESGFSPTTEQAVQAFLVTALKAIGGGE